MVEPFSPTWACAASFVGYRLYREFAEVYGSGEGMGDAPYYSFFADIIYGADPTGKPVEDKWPASQETQGHDIVQ